MAVGYAPPERATPTSWLKPADEVQRSALPLTNASQLPDGGVNGTLRLALSMSCHVEPSLPVSLY